MRNAGVVPLSDPTGRPERKIKRNEWRSMFFPRAYARGTLNIRQNMKGLYYGALYGTMRYIGMLMGTLSHVLTLYTDYQQL